MSRRRAVNLSSFFEFLWNSFRADQADWISSRPENSLSRWIALPGALNVFLVLAVYRWHASTFPLLGFFASFSVVSAMVGLAVGYGAGKRRAIRIPYIFLLLVLQLGFFALLQAVGWQSEIKNPVAEINIPGLAATSGASAWTGVTAFIAIVFILNVLLFRPLGQASAAFMSRLSPTRAYRAHLAGALAGWTLFALLGYFWTPPEAWFLVAFLGLVWLCGSSDTVFPAVAGAALVFSLFCRLDNGRTHGTVYSAYQKIEIQPSLTADATEIVSSASVHERLIDLSREQSQRSPSAQLTSLGVDLPFQLALNPEKVLLVGGGLGNEVAAALRRGATNVDVVDRDPVYAWLGENFHPEKPYAKSQVAFHAQDARTLLRDSDRTFDLILYSAPSRNTTNTWSALAPSFSLTEEAFREAKQKLRPKGMVALSFPALSPAAGSELFATLQAAFERAPLVLQSGYQGGWLFLAGEGADLVAAGSNPPPNLASRFAGPATPATDDWPFFASFPLRAYPASLLILWGALLILSTGMMRFYLPTERRAGMGLSMGMFFFLGVAAAYGCLWSIAEAGWWMGSTWTVLFGWMGVAAVLSWAAAWAVEYWRGLPVAGALGLLFLALVAGWQFQSLRETTQIPWVLGVCAAFAPLALGGVVLPSLLRDHTAIGSALAWCLLGVCVGGGLEHMTWWLGLQSRALIAILSLGGAYGFFYVQRRRTKRPQTHRGLARVFTKKASAGR